MMKKKRVVKLLAGTAVAALCIAGAVNDLDFNAADVIGTAEIGAYAAGTKDEEWKAAHDSLTGAGETVKQAAEDAAAEKTAAAESAQEAETAQTAQTAQKSGQTTQTTQNTQTAQNTQTTTAQPEAPAQSETTQPAPTQAVETPAPTPAPVETPAPAPTTYTCAVCGAVHDNQNDAAVHAATHVPTTYTCAVCGVQYYDQSEAVAHAKTHAAPEPAPAPQPATKWVPVHVCSCGAYFFTYDELCAHQDSYEFHTGHDSDWVAEVEVPA